MNFEVAIGSAWTLLGNCLAHSLAHCSQIKLTGATGSIKSMKNVKLTNMDWKTLSLVLRGSDLSSADATGANANFSGVATVQYRAWPWISLWILLAATCNTPT